MTTTGECLLDLLAARGVSTVFGIPGNHTVALYRGFEERGIRHVTCRHEQGAAFMADGFARATGTPGVCVLISGPGLLNAATGIAQARADSIPMLVITGVAATNDLGMHRGTLHELPDQRAAAASFCIGSHTLLDPANLPAVVDRAWAAFDAGRPGPVHLEIPLNLMEADAPAAGAEDRSSAKIHPPGSDPTATAAAASLLAEARQPLIVVGGGAVAAADSVVALAERLDAPVLNTVNGKGICPASHPLAVGGSPSVGCLREAMGEADVVLAIGTEMGETDYDLLMLGPLPDHGCVIRIDIDPGQLGTPFPPRIGITSAAEPAVIAITDALKSRTPTQPAGAGAKRAADLRAGLAGAPHHHQEMQAFLDALRDALGDGVLVGDSTRPTYYAAWQYECESPRSYFHSVSGFGTLGYALPAAFGAALATNRPVAALIGDGGIQFTLPELTTGAELELSVPVVVWHNDGYREIENSMTARGVPSESTRILAPDFAAAAAAHHCRHAHPTDIAALKQALAEALAADRPTVVEVRESDFLTEPSGDWYP